MKKIICISLLILLSLYRLNAQKKGVPKKITFDNLADATLTDSREGMIVPVDSLDVGIHNFSLGHKLLNSFNSEISQEDLKRAINYFETAISDGYVNALIYAEKGCCEYFVEEHAKAIADLTIALDLNSKEVDANMFQAKEIYEHTDSGYVFHSVGQQYTLWIRPSLILRFRGNCKMELEDYRGAISDYEIATNFKVEVSSELFSRIGWCKMQLENYVAAKIDFNQAILLDMKEGANYFYRGICNYNIKLKESACKDWSKAGELGYEKAYDSIKEYCK